METQHLQHLVAIFSSIISPEKKADKSKNVIHQRIRSLSVYDDEALPFLLQIRQHFSKPGLDSSQQSQTWRIANQTIGSIVGYSQLDLSGQTVISLTDTPTNLRHKEYANYNLDNSHFTNVNLYKANFSGSSLQSSSFTDADLQETKFNNANLKGVSFKNSILRKTNFRNAYLSGVKFSPDCKYLEHAIFSLNTLLKPDSGLFSSLDADKFALLLIPHESELERINAEEKSKLDQTFAKLKIEDFSQLKEKFSELRNQGLASIDDKPKVTRQVSMSSL